jgi:phosphate-selective porin
MWPVMGSAAEKKAEGPKIGLGLQAWYVLDDSDGLSVDNTFRIRRARIFVSGSVTPLVGYSFVGAFEGSSAVLQNAEIHLKFDPMATLRVGQMKYKFTREGNESGYAMPFITRANVVESVWLNAGRTGGAGRDIGIELMGKTKSPIGIEYALAVFNGNGPNKTDDNNSKDIFGRLILTPAPGLEIGGSFFTGKEQVGSPAVKRDVEGWGLDAQFTRGPIRVRGEYVKGEFDNATGAATEPEGWYLLGGYKVLPNLELLARYDFVDLNANAAAQEIDQFTIGFTYEFKKGTRFMVNYIFRDADSGVSTASLFATRPQALGTTIATGNLTGGQLGDVFLVQLQVQF